MRRGQQGRALMRHGLLFTLLSFQSLVIGSCRAEPVKGDGNVPSFEPALLRALRSVGARGDGRSDDLAPLNRAFARPGNACFDGQGATYRVAGTLEVSSDFCLRNATLVQSLPPVDTSPYIRRSCPTTENAAAVADCGDPLIPREQLDRLARALSVRTLLIRPPAGNKPIRVTLDHVKVDRGRFAHSGSRTDSAGIWLEGAARVDFRDVEITGDGKGYGLLLIRSRNVTLSNLYIHDMVWAPYPGEPRLSQARVAAVGWNSVPIHEFRALGQDGVRAAKFYGVRVQEQISCAFLSEVEHVRIENSRISRCMARFDSGDLPWQADGLDIGKSSSDISIDNLAVDSTWEGVDVVANGNGIEGLSITDLTVTNSFAFGLKLGYRLRGADVKRLKVRGAGLAGVSLHGPVKDVTITGAQISGIGKVIGSRGANVSPWPAGERAGMRVDPGGGSGGRPDGVVITDAVVSRDDAASGYAYGLLNTAGGNVRTVRFRPSGYSNAAVGGRQ